MIPSSSGDPTATYTNIPNYILMYLFTLELSRPEWKLYLYLRSKKNNNNGLAWPGVRTTITEAHISKKDVKPARDRLVELGLITATIRPGDTTLIDFNDEQIKKWVYPTGGHTTVPHRGPQGVPHRGPRTITKTTTNLHTTKGKAKRKKKSNPLPPSLSPDANTKTKKVRPTGGHTVPNGAMSPDEVRRAALAFEKKRIKKGV